MQFSTSLISSGSIGRAKALDNRPEGVAVLGLLSISVYFWLRYTGCPVRGGVCFRYAAMEFTFVLTSIAATMLLKEVTNTKEFGVALGVTGIALISLACVKVSCRR